MEIAKRKAWLAAILTLLLPGLGQVYNGQAAKGILFYLIGLTGYAASLLIAVSSLPPPSNIFLPLVTGIIFGLYILFDSILTTRRIGDSYRPKPYNRGYGYLSAIFLSSVLIQPSLKAFGLQAFKIPSAGMSPTLKIGDHILVRKYSYGIRNPFTAKCIGWCKWPDRGDSIVFIFPEDRSKDFIQRVIAVAGDSVEIRTKKVLINGKAINDPHASFEESQTSSLAPANQDDYGPETIPANHLFVLGDNRNRSYDSRFWGFINLDDVRGKAFVIYWSWDSHNSSVRWDRIGQRLQ